MPVYLFTYHTYGSWLPNRPQGYVRRGKGVLPTDHEMADAYRRQMTQDTVLLAEEQQRVAIKTLIEAVRKIEATLHAVAAEATHLHVLVSWSDERPHERIGTSLKRAVTLKLKKVFAEQEWLSENRSRKRIEDREHFDHLIENYLPKHSGWNWNATRGYFKTSDGGLSGET